jgi:PLP dependent protein
MSSEGYSTRIKEILKSIPQGVTLVAAAKTRTPDEVKSALMSGITALGYNYMQEAISMREAIDKWRAPGPVAWHMIGHLQRNKAKKAVELFDMIETIDSISIAECVNRHCSEAGKNMPVLIEINSGRESNKTGVLPEDIIPLAKKISSEFPALRIQGLMTMGPRFGDPENARPYFQLTKKLFDLLLEENIKGIDMKYLSMGMSNSYRQAIEEGATIIRIGTKLFTA